MANKAELSGYSEEPFFKIDKDYEQRRISAWAGKAEQQEGLFWSLVNVLGDRIDYLFKEEIEKDTDRIEWRRVSGGILSTDLRSVIATDPDLFFHDSGFQICLRIPDSGDYFAYDEHGIFWIYSNEGRFIQTLERAGLSERDAPLISDSGHWHVRPKDAKKRLERFIETLITLQQIIAPESRSCRKSRHRSEPFFPVSQVGLMIASGVVADDPQHLAPIP